MEEGESYTVTIRVQKRQKRSKDPKGENGKDIKRSERGKSRKPNDKTPVTKGTWAKREKER